MSDRQPGTGSPTSGSERWLRVSGILERALDYEGAEREAFLDEACGTDASLRQEVRDLLAGDEEGPFFLDSPVFDIHAPDAQVDRRVGAFKIVRLLGRGGMGAVYLAEREDDYRQRVALKLIQSGRDSREIVRRFHAERQILAQLEHPNIPRILDGGTTDDGLPYFAMEYVEGQPIDRYCSDRNVSLGERLELFRQVCAAVHFFHQNLVIHRDLKPGNILVTEDGVPKVLDFGIAKLLETSETLLTAESGLPMTLRYASPEQVRGAPVSTRSDVYSLGVLLFQLLTDHFPYELPTRSPAEIVRAVCEKEPPSPSVVARGSGGEPLARRLAGDLDSIVAKAMRKEPEHRYGSVEQLAEDLRRYREGLPVLARQGSFSYRATKFVRRNKLSMAALTLIVGFAISTTVFGLRALAERDQAARESARAERVLALVTDLLGSNDPDVAKKKDLTVREVLDRGREKLVSGLEEEPWVRAELLAVMGRAYRDLDLLEEARQLFAEELELVRKLYPAPHADLAKSIENLGGVLYRLGALGEAEKLFCEALTLRRELAEEDSTIVRTQNNLALIYRDRGEYGRAEKLYQRGLEMRAQRHGPDDLYVASSLYSLAVLEHIQGRPVDAARTLERVLETRLRELGEVDTGVANVKNSLGRVLFDLGDLERAEALLREALEIRSRLLGEDHLRVLRNRRDLAWIALSRGRVDQAERELLKIAAALRASGREDHEDLFVTENLRASCLAARGRAEEAEALLLDSYRRLAGVVGAWHWEARRARDRIVEFYEAIGRPAETEAFRRAHEPPVLTDADREPCE